MSGRKELSPKSPTAGAQAMRPRASTPLGRIFSSIGMRLVAVVVVTGVLAFAVIGTLTTFRLGLGLHEQAQALGKLSGKQIADRLDGEAQLARARIETLGAESALRLRQIAQRSDIAKAVASENDVTIRELLASVSKTSSLDTLIAFDDSGRVIGANVGLDLLELNTLVQRTHIAAAVRTIIRSNSRARPRNYEGIHELRPDFLRLFQLPSRLTIAHEAIEPVFDDFGDLIGGLVSFRVLAQTESTLQNFSTLSNAGVIILRNSVVVSAAGPQGVTFARGRTDDFGLLLSDDGGHVARCADYSTGLKVCIFTDASIVTATRDQMFRIGAEQTRSLMTQFLIFAALSLVALVCALLLVVHYSTRGLPTLAAAAKAVANGNLEVPFQATGVGEVYDLSLAFESMLETLRSSMGTIRQLAFYDTVTGLPNREKIRGDAPKIIEASKCGALLFLDLDGFKSINDTFGHKSGDVLLKKVAERLTDFFAEELGSEGKNKVTIARVGGDEFVAIVPQVESELAAKRVARNLIDVLRFPFEVGGLRMSIGASVGVTRFPVDGNTYEELLINADLAMYSAKKKGRNTYAFFDRQIADNAKARLSLENDLREAVSTRQLTVEYQPKISCADGRVCGVEALVRWAHPREGNVPTQEFINIAEETGLIAEIDRFVLECSLTEIGRLIGSGADILLAVNVSAADIEDPLFAVETIRLLKKTGFPPSRLELEITESVAMRDHRTVSPHIARLRQLGIRFVIDDFGTGYSNLATLARLPFDGVKLDRSLITNVANDKEKQSIVRIALSLANEFGFETVAEGVETAEDFRFLADAGTTMAQGFLFSKSVSLPQIAAIVHPRRLQEAAAGSRMAAGAGLMSNDTQHGLGQRFPDAREAAPLVPAIDGSTGRRFAGGTS
jgi:diguanylate cyclase (GGDEF)-like protein